MDDYQKFISLSRYSKWIEKEQRRETWDEVIDRFTDYLLEDVEGQGDPITDKVFEAAEAIRTLDLVPSMRALMTAGPALARCNVAGYNCAYIPIDSFRSFDEAMYILMCGTGIGFSVEAQNVNKLPVISEHFEESESTIKVGDSKAGWAKAFRELIRLLSNGKIPKWDVSKVRPAGERLKTFGGRASGPEPLISLFNFTCDVFTKAAGRKLKPIECHDIMCKIGEVVVVGGVRRSALISLSDLDDHEMAKAKSGNWWEDYPHRALANNSAVYTEKPNVGQYLREWRNIYESKSGERGIFNRRAVVEQVRKGGRREFEGFEFGTNPCSEIILRPYQFCNLTEVVVRRDDTMSDLRRKVDLATFLGTVQCRWTNFKYLRKIWQKNCEEERLLGVSLTGIYDNPALVLNPENLRELREYAVDRNAYYSDLFGINQSVAVTCVKPSGTVSQLVDSASGLHPRHSSFYRRTVRGDNKDPMTQFLKDQGVEAEPCAMKPQDTTVFSFYVKSPEGSVKREDLSALDHLNDWLTMQRHWCEHKPSVTINVREEEWNELGDEVYNVFDEMTGVAFLPYSEHTYQQAPYQDITEEEYILSTGDGKISWVTKINLMLPYKLRKLFRLITPASPQNSIDWDLLPEYEKEDTTSGPQTLACTGGMCELVDIGNVT